MFESPDPSKPTTSADHHRDLRRLLSPSAQSSRDREQTDRAPDVPARGWSHPMPKRTRRNAELLLSGSRVNCHFQCQPSFLVATQPPKWWVEGSNLRRWHFELSLLRYVPTEV